MKFRTVHHIGMALFATVPLLFLFLATVAAPSEAEPIPIDITDLSISPLERKSFDLERIPDRLKKLAGKQVVLHGYMYPPFRESGITEFCLNPETKGKSFHFAAGLDRVPVEYYVQVRLKSGSLAYAQNQVFRIVGKLELIPELEDGDLWMLLQITEATAQPVAPRKGFTRSIGWGC